MKPWQHVLLGIFIGIIITTVIGIITAPPRGEAITLVPPPTQIPIVIYITGAVKNPGIYSLDPNSRINDAITVAGGTLPDADLKPINLALPIRDGDKISIPTKIISQPSFTPEVSSLQSGESKETLEIKEISPQNPLNINIASEKDLELLPKIGPSLASAIIKYREQNGPFKNKEDIDNVPGIGPGIYEAIKDYIIVQ
jgi:competence protein ComEA